MMSFISLKEAPVCR